MATIPSEVYPSDATILALDGTADDATGLAYIAKGVGPTSTPTYEIQFNRRLMRQNGILGALRQGMVVDEGSLEIGVYPLSYTLGSVRKSFDGATGQSVPDDATRKVYLDASNALQIEVGYPADVTSYVPLATVTAAAGVLTIIDDRAAILYGVSPIDVAVKSIPLTPSVFLSGTMSVKVWEIEWVAAVDFTLIAATGRVATAPTGAALIVDIRDNGSTIFASDAERINIVAGSQQDTTATVNHAFDAGDVLTFDVKQVGSTEPGKDLTVVLNGRAALDV